MSGAKRRHNRTAKPREGPATIGRRPPTDPNGTHARDLQPWLPAAALALVVAQPFVPGVAIANEGYGAIFVVLWLALVAAWIVSVVKGRSGRLRFSAVDAAAMLFFALYAASGIVAAVRASPRPALNVTWHWLAVGAAFFLFRQLVQGPLARRAVVAVLIALATGMAALGLEQVAVSLPQTRALYARYKDNPQALFEHTGHWLPEGSAVREQFEARLRTAEPTATFALSNSLAALLGPAVVLVIGILVTHVRPVAGNGPRSRVLWLLPIVVVLASCLAYTNSRSGIAATAIGAAVALIAVAKRPRLWAAVVAAAAAAGVGAAYLARPVAFAGAVRSLAYRFEYWQATWRMIGDYPLFGCGSGQFQDTYTAYKLPAASEEVADPHNFLLEVAATGGLPAALVLLATLGLAAWYILRRAERTMGSTTDTLMQPDPLAGQTRYAYLGAAAGILLGMAAAWLDRVPLPSGQLALFAGSVAIALGLLHPWTRSGQMPWFLPGIAAGSLLLHLSVSGGIGEPALAAILWGLLAVQLDLAVPGESRAAEDGSSKRPALPKWSAACGLAGVMGLLIAAYLTYYGPVLRASAHLARANAAAVSGDRDAQLQSIQAAAEADPSSIEAVQRLASLRYAAWEDVPSAEALAAWRAADEGVRRLAPRRHWVWRESAERLDAVYDETDEDTDLQAALAHVRRAAELYPNFADHRLYVAELLDKAGRCEEAALELAAAERLDDAQRAAGHADKTLPPERRAALQRLAERLAAER